MKTHPHPPHTRHHWLSRPISSGAYHPWLTDRGSLTRRLQAHSTSFAVRPLRLADGRPLQDEARARARAPRQRALLREVQLLCQGTAVVFAHSVLPHRSLRGPWQGLGKLGNRPLGATLFADARVSRTALEFRKLRRHHALYQRAAAALPQPPDVLWARRSVFRLRHAMVMVTEVFLPAVLAL